MTGVAFKSFPKFGQTESQPVLAAAFFSLHPVTLAEHRRGPKTVLRTSATSDLTEIPIRLNFFTTHGDQYGTG
jgi:hypothetical protein